MSQTNTRVGDIRVAAGEDLTGKEGFLAKMTHDSGVPEVLLPTANGDYALYVLIEGAADGENVSLRPIEAGRNVRVKLDGTCNPGDVLVLADVATAEDSGPGKPSGCRPEERWFKKFLFGVDRIGDPSARQACSLKTYGSPTQTPCLGGCLGGMAIVFHSERGISEDGHEAGEFVHLLRKQHKKKGLGLLLSPQNWLRG